MKKIVRTVCQGCHSECGVLVHVDDGRVARITADRDHPASRGFICVKGMNYAHFVYHPDRLKYPLRRAAQKERESGKGSPGMKPLTRLLQDSLQ